MVDDVNGISNVKLTDLGFSRAIPSSPFMDPEANYDELPIKFMAPEVIKQRAYSSASDVWAFAVFCWEMVRAARDDRSLMPAVLTWRGAV